MRAPNPIHHPSKSGAAEDDPDPTRPTMPGMGMSVAAGMRKKGLGVRPWLVLDASGQTQVVEAGKHAIMRRTGLPARDLRILDPLLSYPSTVLGRERAIVINLEHIKAIITAQEVLLLNSRDPSVTPFIDELQRRLLRHHQATTKPAKTQDKEGNGEESNWYDMEEAEADAQLRRVVGGNDEDEATGKQGLEENRDALKVLPFEFVALEACLEAACSCLENEARTLEQEAHPALDKLTSKISTLNLERVRQIKSRLVAITGRVQKVRDELEHLLDDDEDMAEMYLTEKLVQQHFENSTTSSLSEREDMDNEAPRRDMDDRIPTEISLEASGGSSNFEGDLQNPDNPQHQFLSRDSHGNTTSSTHSAMGKDLDVEELEMLLEAYFVQIDGTLNKLSTAVHRRQRKDRRKTTSSKAANDFGRRGLLLSAAFATPPVSESGAELLKKYLKKSEENKAKNDKERMDSYYKRNYKDYFEFEEGTIRAKKGELTKSEKGILDWLENNK